MSYAPWKSAPRDVREAPAARVVAYDVLISYDEEAALYAAAVPDLHGVYSQGETLDEAEANVQEAIALYIATARNLGREVPPPSEHVLRNVGVEVA